MPTSKERIAYRKAHGLCVWCGEPIPEGYRSKRLCQKHYERRKQTKEKWLIEIEAGLREAHSSEPVRYGATYCSYYSAAVAEVCLNCTKKRCTGMTHGCREYREALKRERTYTEGGDD